MEQNRFNSALALVVSLIFTLISAQATADNTESDSVLAEGRSAPVLVDMPANLPKDIAKSINDYKSDYGDEYIIGVDDRIQISVWRNADLSISVPVRPDGKVSAPLVGDIQAAGLSPTQLSQLVKIKLAKYVRDPQVSIIVTGLSSHEYISRVRIVGAVRSPQSLPHRKGMTVLDLLLAAGGVNEFASANKATLFRTVEGEESSVQRTRIRLADLIKKGKLEFNMALEPGDIIVVPERLF